MHLEDSHRGFRGIHAALAELCVFMCIEVLVRVSKQLDCAMRLAASSAVVSRSLFADLMTILVRPLAVTVCQRKSKVRWNRPAMCSRAAYLFKFLYNATLCACYSPLVSPPAGAPRRSPQTFSSGRTLCSARTTATSSTRTGSTRTSSCASCA